MCELGPMLTVEEIADLLRVDPEAVRVWLRAGELNGVLISRRAGWRGPEAELRRFLKARGLKSERAAPHCGRPLPPPPTQSVEAGGTAPDAQRGDHR